MPFQVDCPFCNVTTAIQEPLAKVACSRCGETFAPAAYHEAARGTSVTGTSAEPALSTNKRRQVWAFVLIAAVFAGLLLQQLLTQKSPPPAAVPVAPALTTMPPAALAGLRHLPAASNIIIALQPATVAAHAERTGTDVKTLFGSYGVPASVWDTLDRAGVTPADIDHLAAGIVVAKAGIPDIVLVLKLRQPPDLDTFLKKLRAEKKPKAGPAMYSATFASLPVTLLPVNDTTFLFTVTTSDDDLVKLAQQAKPEFAALKPALTERLSPASFAWLATDTRPWSEVSPLLAQEPWKKYGARLAPLRGISVGLSLEPDPTLKVMLDLADAAAAKKCVEALTTLNLDTATVVADGVTVKLLAAATPANFENLVTALK